MPCTTGASTASSSRTTPRSCACSPSVATTWSPSTPGGSIACTSCSAICIPAAPRYASTPADASALLAKIRPVTAADHQRKQIARDVVRDLKRHEASIKELEKQLRAAVTASGTTLTEIQGIGFLTAAKILALTGDIRRFPNQEHYASYAGTAPIDVSSGDQETHRLSRRGNRQLNAAIHVAAVTQARDPGPGRDHYRRKITEHKTAKEARRSLKRRHLQRHLPPHPGRPATQLQSEAA